MSLSERPRYIVVEGPIGVGKTSLAELLAAELGAQPRLRAARREPLPGRLLQDPRRHAMSAQLFYPAAAIPAAGRDGARRPVRPRRHRCSRLPVREGPPVRVAHPVRTTSSPSTSASTRCSARASPRPTLVVYLQAPTRCCSTASGSAAARREADPRRVPRRDRAAYAEFFFHYDEGPLLIVDASEIDFVANPDHRADLFAVIRRTRAGVNHWKRAGRGGRGPASWRARKGAMAVARDFRASVAAKSRPSRSRPRKGTRRADGRRHGLRRRLRAPRRRGRASTSSSWATRSAWSCRASDRRCP